MANSPIRLLIADDMDPIREYLNMVLGHEPDMQIIGSVATGKEALELAVKTKPDVMLLDVEMETPKAGVEVIRALSEKKLNIRCVILTHFGDDETVPPEAGAVDYVLKNASAAEILESVRSAACDMSPIRPQVAHMIREEFRVMRAERASLISTLNIVYKLTPTELALLRLLAEGKTQKEIAEIRYVAPSTIRTHVANILKI